MACGSSLRPMTRHKLIGFGFNWTQQGTGKTSSFAYTKISPKLLSMKAPIDRIQLLSNKKEDYTKIRKGRQNT
ncbi:hypothetical protein HKD37_01G002076 [Glycine soja]